MYESTAIVADEVVLLRQQPLDGVPDDEKQQLTKFLDDNRNFEEEFPRRPRLRTVPWPLMPSGPQMPSGPNAFGPNGEATCVTAVPIAYTYYRFTL